MSKKKDNYSSGKVALKILAICLQNIKIAFFPENKTSLLDRRIYNSRILNYSEFTWTELISGLFNAECKVSPRVPEFLD